MTNLSELITPGHAGCWIDCSHFSAHELDYRIVYLAHNYGYDVDIEQIQKDMEMYDDLSYDEVADVNEALWEEAALAIDWLNGQVDDPRFTFYVDDNSLYLEFDDQSGTEYNL